MSAWHSPFAVHVHIYIGNNLYPFSFTVGWAFFCVCCYCCCCQRDIVMPHVWQALYNTERRITTPITDHGKFPYKWHRDGDSIETHLLDSQNCSLGASSISFNKFYSNNSNSECCIILHSYIYVHIYIRAIQLWAYFQTLLWMCGSHKIAVDDSFFLCEPSVNFFLCSELLVWGDNK